MFSFWSTQQKVELNYKALVVLTLAVAVCKPALSIIMIKSFEDKATALIAGSTIIDIIAYTPLYIKSIIPRKIKLINKYWRYAFRFCIPLIPHYLSQTLLSSSDRIMIERIVGSDKAGIYGLAYSASLVMTMFNTALISTISPWTMEKIKGKKTTDIRKVAYPALLFVAIINLCLIIVAPELIALFAPKEYYEAIWVVPPVSLSVIFMFSYDMFSQFEFYYEKTSYIAVSTMLSAGMNIILNYIFIKKYGFIAAGYTTLICYILYSLAHYLFMYKIIQKEDLKNPYNFFELILIGILTIAIGLLFGALYKYTIIRYFILAVLLLVIIIKRNVFIKLFKKKNLF